MDRRKFLYSFGLGAASVFLNRDRDFWPTITDEKALSKQTYWLWMNADLEASDDEWKQRFEKLRKVGFEQILVNCYNGKHAFYESGKIPIRGKLLERILPIAASQDIRIHVWMYSLLCNVDFVAQNKPEWFVINREGNSSLNKPPYVDYYRWLCPSRPDVRAFVQDIVNELCQYDGLAGIHLDYIRYPDVILPKALQPKYHLKQDREYPEFDFCYCPECCETFRSQTGENPVQMADPSANKEWRLFRETTITNLVSSLAGIARSHDKMISAAVFATPQLARQFVRQAWDTWDLDAFFPMIYHNFYDEKPQWILNAVCEGLAVLPKEKPLYAGLFVPELDANQLQLACDLASQGGATGVSLFSWRSLKEEHWQVLQKKN